MFDRRRAALDNVNPVDLVSHWGSSWGRSNGGGEGLLTKWLLG